MISIIIVVFIMCLVVFGVVNYYMTDISIFDKLFCIFAGTFFGLLIGMLISVSVGSILPKDEYISYTEPIISVELGSEVNGGFVLGSGGVHEDLKYYYYKQDDYGFRLQSVSVKNTYITEDSEYPLIEVHSKRFKNIELDKWFICPQEDSYNLRLPQNSMVREIKLGGNI